MSIANVKQTCKTYKNATHKTVAHTTTNVLHSLQYLYIRIYTWVHIHTESLAKIAYYTRLQVATCEDLKTHIYDIHAGMDQEFVTFGQQLREKLHLKESR